MMGQMKSVANMARNRYDVDEELETVFDMGQMKRLGKYLSPYKKEIIFVIIIMLSASGISMMIPQIFRYIIDVCIPEGNMNGIWSAGAVTICIAIYVSIALRIKIKLTSKIGQNVVLQIRKDIFVHLQELPFSYYDDRPHGKIQVRVVNYINNLSDLLSNGIINTVTDLCTLIFIILFMLQMNVILTLVCLGGLPFLFLLIFIIKKRQRRAWQTTGNKLSNLNAYIAESIDGIRVTQSFVRENHNEGIFNGLSNAYKNSWLQAVKYNVLIGPAIDNISTMTMVYVLLLGVYWLKGAEFGITIGVIIAFTGYIGNFWTPITTLGNFYNSLLTAISYLERIFETIDEEVSVKDRADAVQMPPIQGRVNFKDVKFSYEDGASILKGINFQVDVNESVAIVGPTGAGKTTIVNLLSRFYNVTEGRILVDNIDISTVTLKSLRSQLGIMMQDSFIFSGTILENICYGNKEAGRESAIRAAKTVCAHDFIMNLENGYDTEVNERGSRLSAGERQLISFARALLADPRILILDEATSNIDTETEIMLQRGVQELLKERTSFLIAHRLSTIRNCTKIMYVDQGEIVEIGSHEELLAKKGDYYRLYCAQAQKID